MCYLYYFSSDIMKINMVTDLGKRKEIYFIKKGISMVIWGRSYHQQLFQEIKKTLLMLVLVPVTSSEKKNRT